MKGHHFGGRGLADAAVEPDHAGLEAARAHVLGEGTEACERLLDAPRNGSAGSVAADQEALADETVECLADGCARQGQPFGQFALTGERGTRLEHAFGEGGAEPNLELAIEHRGAAIGGAECLAEEVVQRRVGGGAHGAAMSPLVRLSYVRAVRRTRAGRAS